MYKELCVVKRFVSFVLTFFLLFILGACNSAVDSTSAAQDEQIAALESRIAELEGNSQMNDNSEPQPEIFEEARQYFYRTEQYTDGYYPILTLYGDGTFEFKASITYTMGFFYGNYKVIDNSIHLEVLEELIVGDYPSKVTDVRPIEFNIDGENIVMVTGYGESFEGDIFVRSAEIISTEFPVDERVPANVSPFKAGQAVGFINAEGGLNLRSGPGTEYDSLALIPDGYPTSAIGKSKEDSEWYYVNYDNTFGFVNSEYVSLGYM